MLLFASFVDLDQFFLSEEAPGGDVSTESFWTTQNHPSLLL